MTTIHKSCSCGYVGDNFGKDMSREDGLMRYCRPCARERTANSAAKKAARLRAWHQSPEFAPGTVAPDSWLVANGYQPRRERRPVVDAIAAITTQADYERQAHGDPNAERPRNPNLPPD